MGIFMITISQISSHTAIRVYPGNPGLDLPLDQLLSGDVVLRDDEGRPRAVELNPPCERRALPLLPGDSDSAP